MNILNYIGYKYGVAYTYSKKDTNNLGKIQHLTIGFKEITKFLCIEDEINSMEVNNCNHFLERLTSDINKGISYLKYVVEDNEKIIAPTKSIFTSKNKMDIKINYIPETNAHLKLMDNNGKM
jgi:hypothetical protein